VTWIDVYNEAKQKAAAYPAHRYVSGTILLNLPQEIVFKVKRIELNFSLKTISYG